MPMTWDDAAKAKLFAALLQTSNVTPNCAAIAQIMGSDCTAKAVSHQIANIRNKAKGADISTPNDGNENGKSPATPSRRGRKKAQGEGEEGASASKGKKKGTTASGRKRKLKEDFKEEVKQEADDDEAENLESTSEVAEEVDDSPSPMAKKAKVEANGPVVKEE